MKLKYRPEIDSLRAISVLGVIIYHSKIYFFGELFFQGGYFGVDIFFVISGYLITSIILKELITTKVLVSLIAVCIGIYFVKKGGNKQTI